MLTQNLAKGISTKQLTEELKELYPAYSRNASSILNTGMARLFTDINVTKFRQSDIRYFLYAGPDDAVTRERPCKHWVWHWFPQSQLDQVTAVRMTLWNCRHNIVGISEEETKSYPKLNLSFAP